MLRIVKPKGNHLISRVSNSEDRKRQLDRMMASRQREEREIMVGRRRTTMSVVLEQ